MKLVKHNLKNVPTLDLKKFSFFNLVLVFPALFIIYFLI